MTLLTLRVLGPLQVAFADAPPSTLESDKARALLAFLAVEADRPHRREALIGLLWPDCPEQTARHNLRQTLFNVRQAIGDHTATPPYLLISRDEIQFNAASDYTLDVARFNTLFNTCDRQLPRCVEDCAIRAARLEEVVQLYRGQFLEQFFLQDSAAFEEWALVQREALHQRALDALAYLANYHEQHGDYELARRHTARQLELDPWREEAHRQMMRVLALSGQPSAALKQFETCRRMLAEELGVEPSIETRELYKQISQGEFSTRKQAVTPAPPPTVHNLPAQLTPFIGRERELVDLGRLIADPECRLITLVGPGGIGKTRLALQTASHHRNLFAHGAVFVQLASIRSTDSIVPAMADALGFSFYGRSDPKAQLLNYLREKQMLLVLDNVEQLLEGAGLFVEILQHAPEIKLLLTSRESLNLQGEWVFELEGLNVPESGQTEGFEDYSAVALFLQRARRARAGFVLDAPDRAAVARLCRLVEGMPLALELAATWVRTLSPAEIAAEIERSLDILSASVRDLPERHRSMRAVFDYSWQMLSAEEQRVLCGLSVFRGGFLREAAEQVAGASLSLLSALVTRSLVRRTSTGRYDLHELIRQCAAERLEADPKACSTTEERHYAFYVTLAETADPELRGSHQMEWLGRLEQERDNLQAALEWSLTVDKARSNERNGLALRLAGTLSWFWYMHGYFGEGRDWLMKALDHYQGQRMAMYARALEGAAFLAHRLGDHRAARSQAEESATIFRELGDNWGLAGALTVAGLALEPLGETSASRSRFEEALALYRVSGDRWGVARGLANVGSHEITFGDQAAGRMMLEESVAILEELGDRFIISNPLGQLGDLAFTTGQYASARSYIGRSLTISREIGDPEGVALFLVNLGQVMLMQGDYAAARAHFEESLTLYRERGQRMVASALGALAENDLIQGDLPAARARIRQISATADPTENRWLEARVRYWQGLLAYYEGDTERAAALLAKSLAFLREIHHQPGVAQLLVILGRVMRACGDSAQAATLLKEGLLLYQRFNHKLGVATALEGFAGLAVAKDAALGTTERAAQLFGAADTIRQTMGAPLPPVDLPDHERDIATLRDLLSNEMFARAWAKGQAMSLDQAVVYALCDTHPEI